VAEAKEIWRKEPGNGSLLASLSVGKNSGDAGAPIGGVAATCVVR
jgi:hypothetical protein